MEPKITDNIFGITMPKEKPKLTHFLYVPFTGLGLYGGHRGKRWLKNRIKIFKQFVVPSLEAQTNQNFILWVSWRHEDRGDTDIESLEKYLKERFDRVVFTYAGVCFWDDKYPDEVARERLLHAIQWSAGDLMNIAGETDTVLMTIQPSDDCYHKSMVNEIQTNLMNHDLDVFGYRQGYVMDYVNHRIAEWNPKTTPPFYTIKFTHRQFFNPITHLEHTGPYKSHEYVKNYLKAHYSSFRGFLVGTHGENISTIFNHPYAGGDISPEILKEFGLQDSGSLKISFSLRKRLMRKLPHGWQRKLRYWLGERLFAKVYNWIRS